MAKKRPDRKKKVKSLMELLLRNGHVFTPQYLGVNDILVENGVITRIRPGISVSAFACAREVDVSGMFVIPGFIDSHVHIIGGGGETGEASLIPSFYASDFYSNGITGCVGIQSFEGRKKSPQMLYEKAESLIREGIETLVLSGSRQMPPLNLFKAVAEDIWNHPLCIGVGEIALEDNCVQGFLLEQVILLLQTVYKAAKKTQKPLKTVFYIGNKASDLSLIFRMVKIYPHTLEIAIPTHVNRSKKILEDAVLYIQAGGIVDVSAGVDEDQENGFVPAPEALEFILGQTGSLKNVTLSSDAGRFIPEYNRNKNIVSCSQAKACILAQDIQKAYRRGIKLSELLPAVTVNPASAYGFAQGLIFEGAKAFLNITDDDLSIRYTVLNGAMVS